MVDDATSSSVVSLQSDAMVLIRDLSPSFYTFHGNPSLGSVIEDDYWIMLSQNYPIWSNMVFTPSEYVRLEGKTRLFASKQVCRM